MTNTPGQPLEGSDSAPRNGALVDRFGRAVGSLRLSITDRCDLRCLYCMPEEGVKWLPKMQMLRVQEYTRLVRIAAGMGITQVRITGGEPLLHPQLEELVVALRAVEGVEDLAMTTNGVRLAERAQALRDAGLDRVNISLDTIERNGFTAITRRDRLPEVLEGLAAADAAGLGPIKINTVVMRGWNEQAILDLAELGRWRPYQVRFIEYMPLDAQRQWELDRVVPAAEIRERIESRWPVEALPKKDRAPAQLFRYLDGAGTFGIIASISQPFCTTCDRVRVSADGRIRSCLFALEDTDLSTHMRGGADDATLERLLREAIWGKWEGHAIQTARFVQPDGGMNYFGG